MSWKNFSEVLRGGASWRHGSWCAPDGAWMRVVGGLFLTVVRIGKKIKKIQKFGKLRLREWKKRWVEKRVEKIVTKKNRRIKHADIARKQEVVCLPCMCACKIAGGCGGGNSGEKNRIKKHPGPHGNRQKARGGCLGRLPEVLTYAPAAPVDRRRRRRPSLHFSPTPAACVFRSADRKR